MDFRLTKEQRALRQGMRELLARRFGRERLREAVDGAGGAAVDRGLWRELGAAGVFALRLPEAEGGVGLGTAEAVLVFEEAGRALLPGPLVATHLAAGYVPGAAEGAAVVTAADFAADPAGGGPPGSRRIRSGPVALVEHVADADAVLCLDGDGDGDDGGAAVAVRPPAELDAEPIRSVDPAVPLHRVRRPTTDSAAPADAPRDAAALRRDAALLTAALQLGSAGRTVEMAVAHAREREQFGRPIGAFQAVKHLCAGLLVRTEAARCAVYAAAVTGAPADVAAAKLLADEAAVRGARDCLQVYGGLGFSWEADVHLHLKRAWLRAGQWLRQDAAEEELAATLTTESM